MERGYARTTLGAIAKRAGTTTPAIYRRWPSKAHLVHEVVIPGDFTTLPRSEGNLRDGLRVLVCGTRAIFGTPVARAAFPGLLTDIAAHPELHDRLLERFRRGVFADLRQRLTASVATGEIADGVEVDRILETLAGAVVFHVMLQPDDLIDDRWVEQTVDVVLHGVRPR